MENSRGECDFGITRRSAIGGGLVAAGTIVASGLPARAGEPSAVAASYLLPDDQWVNLINEDFQIVNYSFDNQLGNAPRIRLRLVDSSPVNPSCSEGYRAENLKASSVSLLFRAPRNVVLEDASYRLLHPRFGQFDLLISRTESDNFERDNVYEAILN